MGNVSLKVLEKSLNFLFKKRFAPCELEFVKMESYGVVASLILWLYS